MAVNNVTTPDKVVSILGFAMRAGKVLYGCDSIERYHKRKYLHQLGIVLGGPALPGQHLHFGHRELAGKDCKKSVRSAHRGSKTKHGRGYHAQTWVQSRRRHGQTNGASDAG